MGLSQDLSKTRLWRLAADAGEPVEQQFVPNLNNLRLIIDKETMHSDEMRCGHKRLLANGRLTRRACNGVLMLQG